MSIQKIVIGTDFSTEAEAAVDHGVRVARHTGAELVFVHACVVIEAALEHGSGGEWTEYQRGALAQVRGQLDQLADRVRERGVRVSHRLVEDAPAHGVIRAASEIGADLTVVSTHGRTGLRRFLLGSEAARIARGSETAVLVARPTPSAPDRAAGYDRILVATDFSDTAELALETAIGLVAPGGAIDVLHVWSLPTFGPLPEPALLGRQLQQKAASRGTALIERHRADGFSLSFAAIEGVPREAICDHADAAGAQLVVVGSHGRRGPSRWLLGSVAESVVRHASCSVLVVKPRPAAGFDV